MSFSFTINKYFKMFIFLPLNIKFSCDNIEVRITFGTVRFRAACVSYLLTEIIEIRNVCIYK